MNNKGLTVISHNGILVVDSRDVAKMVDRPHNDLMKSIRQYCEYLTAGNFSLSDFFISHTYKDSTGRELPCFLLTRKGCDIVAHKMTGEKGLLFTATYVNRFYEMERQIEGKLIPKTFSEALRLAADLADKNELLEKENQVMLPKAEYFDDLVERNLLTNFRDTAKEFKVKEKDFISLLINKKYIFKNMKNEFRPHAGFEKSGLFEVKEYRNRFSGHTGVQTLITPKGRETLRLIVKKYMNIA